MESYKDYGIELPAGAEGEVRVICPQCTPSRKLQHQNEKDLSVNVDNQTWYCHHCSWADGLKDHQDPKPQKQEKGPTYQKPDYSPAALPDKLVQYFRDRGISNGTLEKAYIGYEPPKGKKYGAIMFPRYKGGEVVAIKYRTYDKRMWQSKNPMPCFFNYDMALKSGDSTLIIVEGEVDALSWIEAGFPNVASVPDGAPPVNTKNPERKYEFLNDGLVGNFTSFVLAVDDDEPGKALEGELANRLGRQNCLRVHYPAECKDSNDVLKKHGAETLIKIYQKATPFPIDGLYTTEDVWDAVLDLYQQGLKPGNSTGWENLDHYYTVRPGEMTIVTGIPSHGKSTWLDALTVNLYLQHEWKVAYCSPENWPIQRHMASIVEKLQAKPFAARTPSSSRMTPEEVNRALDEMNGSFFFTQIDDQNMHIESILEIMQAAISRHGVKGIIIDPWNELEHHRPKNMSETDYVSWALGKIRRFARLNYVHVWVVAHPTKLNKKDDGTYPVPTLYDISGSAHWYNKADNGIAVHRPKISDQKVNIHIQKVRFREVGNPGEANMIFSKDSGSFIEDGNE